MDENYGPDFNDDFLDDYAEPNYADEDIDYYLSTLQDAPTEAQQPKIVDENEPSRELRQQKREHSFDLPIGAHPLDWFVNSEFDSSLLKRKKRELADLKSLSLLEKITSKRDQLHKEQSNSTLNDEQIVPQEPYLRSRPIDCQFYEFSSPDCLNLGYLKVYEPEPITKRTFTQKPNLNNQLDKSVLENVSSTKMLEMADIRKKTSDLLWSEKYQPKSFLELLTEDEQNKVVLTWLKTWDQHVFKSHKTYEMSVSDFYKKMMEVEESIPYLPKKKILFLHGSSGCSKSTLAKICALQAGYLPVFIDASEFPNAAKFKEYFTEATGNAKISFSSGSNKPVCPIIENVDSANTDVINCLSKIFEKTSKKNQTFIRRPIIIISNNFYSASLRVFRPICFAIHIQHLAKERTIHRLQKICALEDLDIKRHVLLDLFEQCNGDLRLCLNNLQYLCSFWWKNIEFSKEMNARFSEFSIFDAMNIILTTNSHYSGNKILPPRQRAQTISHMLSRRSDLDLLYHAIFYNIGILGKLRSFQKRRICNLLSSDSIINSFMRHTQNWSLLRYTNTAGILIHFLVANYNAKRLSYNLNFMKFGDKTKECKSIIESFMENLKPQHRLSPSTLQLDLLPALYDIIQPTCNLSATQIQLCDPAEASIIHKVVEIMNFYGLSFSSSFDNALFDMKIEPNIGSVVVYPSNSSVKATPALNVHAKKIVEQLLSKKKFESEIIRETKKPIGKKGDPNLTEFLADHQRVPGLALLSRKPGFMTTSKDVVYLTSTKLKYNMGNSNAIRIKVLNKSLFSFF